MSGSDRIVDASGSGVSVDTRALAERFLSYPVYGALLSVVAYIELVGQGIATAITSLGEWLVSLVESIVGIPLSALSVSEVETVEFIGLSGVLGLLVSVVLVSLAAYSLVRGIVTAWGIVRGGIV